MKQSEYDRLGRRVWGRLKTDPRFLLKIMGAHYRWHAGYLKQWRQMSKINSEKFSNFQLGQWMEKYANSVSEFWSIGMTPLFVEAVARELKVPCVIGTKIVTRVLKDGDMVEVDAEKGIVRKI